MIRAASAPAGAAPGRGLRRQRCASVAAAATTPQRMAARARSGGKVRDAGCTRRSATGTRPRAACGRSDGSPRCRRGERRFRGARATGACPRNVSAGRGVRSAASATRGDCGRAWRAATAARGVVASPVACAPAERADPTALTCTDPPAGSKPPTGSAAAGREVDSGSAAEGVAATGADESEAGASAEASPCACSGSVAPGPLSSCASPACISVEAGAEPAASVSSRDTSTSASLVVSSPAVVAGGSWAAGSGAGGGSAAGTSGGGDVVASAGGASTGVSSAGAGVGGDSVAGDGAGSSGRGGRKRSGSR
jgi:hypothetical protein